MHSNCIASIRRRLASCRLPFAVIAGIGFAAGSPPEASADPRCLFSIHTTAKLEQTLKAEVAAIAANIERLEQKDSGIEPSAARELIAHYRALLSEARAAQRVLAENVDRLKSVSGLPAASMESDACRNHPTEPGDSR